METPKKRQINVYIDSKVYETVKREAKAEGRTFSNYIARIIDSRPTAAGSKK